MYTHVQQLHCTGQWGQWTLLNEHVYYVAIAFKMTVSRARSLHQILPYTCAFVRGNYLDDSEGRSYGHLVIGSFIMTMCLLRYHVSCRDFCATSNHSGDSTPVEPRFGTLWLLAFPKTKFTFEREEISDHQWDSGKYDGAADGSWENSVRSRRIFFEGDWGIIVLCTMFLVSCIFFNKSLYFSYCLTGHFLDRPYMHTWQKHFCACPSLLDFSP